MKIIRKIGSYCALLIGFSISCSNDPGYIKAPSTVNFEPVLAAYNIYRGNPTDLIPTSGFERIELSSSLFVNYAQKQRLVKLPPGGEITKLDNGVPSFPNGTILVKTFYYFKDDRDPNLGKQLIETRLLIKAADQWNVATYVWNDVQTEAHLKLDGLTKSVSWTTANGQARTVSYKVPSERDCTTCHQTAASVMPLGPTLTNMNKEVQRNGQTINQLLYFQNKGLLSNFDHHSVPSLPNYLDQQRSIQERGRAYLEMNCAHCHNPAGFPKAARKRYDFRYTTPIGTTRILDKKSKIINGISSGEMPWIGTTVVDQEGLQIVKTYINSL